jgi:predicted MFS family arabinose efflux permease
VGAEILTGNPVQRGIQFVKRQQRAFKANMARLLVSNFSLSLTQQYQSIYITELGATPVELGLVTSLGGVASTLITIPIGWLADRYGIKKMLLAGFSIAILGYAIFGLAFQWQTTALALVATTLAWQITRTVCPMICGTTLASSERATGMQFCDTATAFPRFIAPIVGAYLITRFGGISDEGIRPLFWLEVAGLFIATLIILRFFVDPIRHEEKEPPQLLEGLRRVLQEGVMVKRWIAQSFLSVLPVFMAIYVPLYARDVKGASQYTLGLMDSAYWLLIFLLAIPTGLAADRIGNSDAVLIASGLLSGCLWLTLVTQVSIWGDLIPMDLFGSWSGLMGLFRGLANIFAPILGGLLWNSFGPEYVMYFLVATQVARVLILATIPSSVTGD